VVFSCLSLALFNVRIGLGGEFSEIHPWGLLEPSPGWAYLSFVGCCKAALPIRSYRENRTQSWRYFGCRASQSTGDGEGFLVTGIDGSCTGEFLGWRYKLAFSAGIAAYGDEKNAKFGSRGLLGLNITASVYALMEELGEEEVEREFKESNELRGEEDLLRLSGWGIVGRQRRIHGSSRFGGRCANG